MIQVTGCPFGSLKARKLQVRRPRLLNLRESAHSQRSHKSQLSLLKWNITMKSDPAKGQQHQHGGKPALLCFSLVSKGFTAASRAIWIGSGMPLVIAGLSSTAAALAAVSLASLAAWTERRSCAAIAPAVRKAAWQYRSILKDYASKLNPVNHSPAHQLPEGLNLDHG